jgi:hypothetical protein
VIDANLVDIWDAEVIKATARFDQGDLVERPPFFYAGRPAYGVVQTTRALAADVEPDEALVIELDPLDGPPYGVLTSQGCDIADSARKPWVQVAPVYPFAGLADGDRRLADIRRDSVPHLVLLEPPSLDGLWIADLRIEMPVEKSWLVAQEPIAAFTCEDDRRRFRRRLAGRLERPALPDVVHDLVVRPLRRVLDRANAALRTDLGDAGVEFRLAVRTHPDDTYECRLLVIGRRAPVPESVIETLDTWWQGLPKNEVTVTLLACHYSTSDEISMRQYLASELLDDRYLGADAPPDRPAS